jgi:hypothetical protein
MNGRSERKKEMGRETSFADRILGTAHFSLPQRMLLAAFSTDPGWRTPIWG